MGKVVALYNCQVFSGEQEDLGELWVQDGRVVAPEAVRHAACDKAVDCGGRIVSPGFVDLQVRGAFGTDFAALQPEHAQREIEQVARQLPRTGVTAFCPTIATTSQEYFRALLPRLSRSAPADGAAVLGFHINGLLVGGSPEKGTPAEEEEEIMQQQHQQQQPHFRRNLYEARTSSSSTAPTSQLESESAALHAVAASSSSPSPSPSQDTHARAAKADAKAKAALAALEAVSLVTLAPEAPGSLDAIRQLTRRGICVSLQSAVCSFAQASLALEAGARMISLDAAAAFHPRDPSLVGLLAAERPPYLALIADGSHTHAVALRMAQRIAPQGLVLVSNAVAPLGLGGLGAFRAGDTHVLVRPANTLSSDDSDMMSSECQRVCVLQSELETLFGSVTPLNECVRNLVEATGCSVAEALQAATLRPAAAVNAQDRKGSLEPGKDADFVLLEPGTLQVHQTWIAGELVYSSSSSSSSSSSRR